MSAQEAGLTPCSCSAEAQRPLLFLSAQCPDDIVVLKIAAVLYAPTPPRRPSEGRGHVPSPWLWHGLLRGIWMGPSILSPHRSCTLTHPDTPDSAALSASAPERGMSAAQRTQSSSDPQPRTPPSRARRRGAGGATGSPPPASKKHMRGSRKPGRACLLL